MNALDLAQRLAKTPKVLIVDDDEFIRLIFTKLMDKYDIEVICLNSPQEGIVAMKNDDFDVVFLDMKFHATAMSGMDFLRHVNAVDSKAQTVIMSGSVNLHDIMAEANRLGVLSFMLKPVSFTHDYVVSILRRLGMRLVKKTPVEADSP